MRASLLPVLALLAACGGEAPAPQPTGSAAPQTLRDTLEDPLATPAALPPQVAEFPALSSRTCMDVVRFYGDALAAGEWEQAALAWADPVIDGARLQSVFGSYQQPAFTWGDPVEEGAAGSLYCTVEGTLTDAATPGTAPVSGTLELKRVNDVDGATPTQLRWTVRSSSFIEPTERSGPSS
ncbi:hypothetical protein [Croceibacterium mercuriale]|uniref:hypothetical protein n=1 Tax=Croceibacterium mercuriale TaxID=1572751 RepID=UPI0006914EC0|nr:hypothetical protein [Croceibacterium mercuriale]